MIKQIFQNLFFIMFLMASLLVEAREKITMPELYFLAVNSNSIYTTVFINDVPLVDLKDGSSVMNETPVAGWLMPGENKLKIRVWAAPEMNSITGNVSASIYLHDPTSEVPKPLKILAEASFPNPESDPEQKQETIEKAFEFSGETRAKLWIEAQTISEIDESDQVEMMALVDGLGKAVNNGDIDAAIEYQKYKILDDALVEGSTAEEIEMIVKANYTWLQGQEGIELRRYNPHNIEFSIMANNKVVKITKNTGDEILQLESNDLFFEIPIFMSKIHGSWKIVR